MKRTGPIALTEIDLDSSRDREQLSLQEVLLVRRHMTENLDLDILTEEVLGLGLIHSWVLAISTEDLGQAGTHEKASICL